MHVNAPSMSPAIAGLVFQGDWAAFDSQPELKSRYLAV